MKRNSQLFQSELDRIYKAQWYRQRFDACPHFMFFLGDAHVSNIQQTKYPFGQRIAYAGFSHNRADWYHGLAELEYTASHIIEVSKHDAQISQRMIQDFLPWQEEFYATCLTLAQTDLTKLTDTELLETYNTLAAIYTNKLNSSPLIDGFALSTDTLIASKIKSFLESNGLEDRFVEFFAILTAPTFLSFLQEEEIALLRITDDDVVAHQAQWFWLRNNYTKDHVESIEAFEQRLRGYTSVDKQKRIEEIQSLATQHKLDKKRLIQEIDLPEEIQSLLQITDDFNAWQDERKKGTFWATHYFSLLLEEFSKRTKYTLDQLKYAFPPEMGEILSGTIDPKELDQRIEYCMVLWTPGQYDLITDISLIDRLDRIGTGEVQAVSELKGFTASRGVVSGTVKVLESVEEVYKIEEGDILVAVMTRPDYIPAMKRAAAFVTDEGGITCHAAIVAREMKKPCIIGTKVATKTLKDGDWVEVDGNTGIVRHVLK